MGRAANAAATLLRLRRVARGQLGRCKLRPMPPAWLRVQRCAVSLRTTLPQGPVLNYTAEVLYAIDAVKTDVQVRRRPP